MERLRLLLSTFQDGTGMLDGGQAPGWRDFERVAASWLGGTAPESKHIYDVHCQTPDGRLYGFSCKIRGTLGETRRRGDATIEVSNSAKKLWDGLKAVGINDENLTVSDAGLAGATIISTVESWYLAVSSTGGGSFMTEHSPMLHLAYSVRTGEYQLFVFDRHLPSNSETAALTWTVTGNRLLGLRPDGKRGVEWYFGSGGQLKYYPRIDSAVWRSEIFTLEPIGMDKPADALVAKALTYFPEQWADAVGVSGELLEGLGLSDVQDD